MAHPESLVHQLDSVLLAHVRVMPLPEQWPRQHLPKPCNAIPRHDTHFGAICSSIVEDARSARHSPGRLHKPQRVQTAVQLLAIEHSNPCLAKETCLMHTIGWHRVRDVALRRLPVAMCSSWKWTPSMLIVPRKGFSS